MSTLKLKKELMSNFSILIVPSAHYLEKNHFAFTKQKLRDKFCRSECVQCVFRPENLQYSSKSLVSISILNHVSWPKWPQNISVDNPPSCLSNYSAISRYGRHWSAPRKTTTIKTPSLLDWFINLNLDLLLKQSWFKKDFSIVIA